LDYLAGVRGSPHYAWRKMLWTGSTEDFGSSSRSSSLALATWREARAESTEAQRGILHTVVNRVAKAGWWGTDGVSVSLKLFQVSCFNHGAQIMTRCCAVRIQ